MKIKQSFNFAHTITKLDLNGEPTKTSSYYIRFSLSVLAVVARALLHSIAYTQTTV